ncbi:TdeIII family type II restriction endonuclease [Streptobacillus moniliformis]|uniref:type II site-specific deoxyribonuclease n=1 Tax=Streptobacillus moniliformis (strain ATCC 14647 / DSM 12112 / NCTC 10651 / 9901) TaxID=519441 RepID=D1AX52_STRM9|nr:TdeIII family type II restriction endonuclease [Streptobacillus moniliformis]ACZ00878.1 hypothetical protein Smon_0395 [Streptobacillus moniliformis DSM 12112]AVL42735.1 TdeIII family type II restriction endonuclease [Streptobacillus moniliformis]SQA13985.1 Uncharacterised protein [Streptobacillus moniliformis]
MTEFNKKAIEEIVDSNIKKFAMGLEERYINELNDPNGVIHRKKNNCFISELGREFMFYSAFVRSFDSSFGKVLENIGNSIAKLNYKVKSEVSSFLLPQQSQHIDYLMLNYEKHMKPKVEDYKKYNIMIPNDVRSFAKKHKTDHYFYDEENKTHYLIELKSSGDLDNKKAKTEKIALLQEYFILKNSINLDEDIKIFLATAYNIYGEGNYWKQDRVRQFFSDDELMIGRKYWNFVCKDEKGFEIFFNQYKKSCNYIRKVLSQIKNLYFLDETEID